MTQEKTATQRYTCTGLLIQKVFKDRTNLSEGLDSRQAALNLAGAQPYVKFDLFLTFTCNQKCHPGVKHLYEWKEGCRWRLLACVGSSTDGEKTKKIKIELLSYEIFFFINLLLPSDSNRCEG